MYICCVNDVVNDDKVSAEKENTVLLFSVINKDSAHVVGYRFEKLPGDGQGFSFNYANGSDSFTFLASLKLCNFAQFNTLLISP